MSTVQHLLLVSEQQKTDSIFNFQPTLTCIAKSQTPLHEQVVQHVDKMLAGGETTPEHLDMSRCWDVAKFCS